MAAAPLPRRRALSFLGQFAQARVTQPAIGQQKRPAQPDGGQTSDRGGRLPLGFRCAQAALDQVLRQITQTAPFQRSARLEVPHEFIGEIQGGSHF